MPVWTTTTAIRPKKGRSLGEKRLLASEHFGRCLDLVVADPRCREEKMEILVFAVIASYNAHRRQEQVVPEPEEFQPFDLQALRNSAKVELSGQWQSGLGVHGDNCFLRAEANG